MSLRAVLRHSGWSPASCRAQVECMQSSPRLHHPAVRRERSHLKRSQRTMTIHVRLRHATIAHISRSLNNRYLLPSRYFLASTEASKTVLGRGGFREQPMRSRSHMCAVCRFLAAVYSGATRPIMSRPASSARLPVHRCTETFTFVQHGQCPCILSQSTVLTIVGALIRTFNE